MAALAARLQGNEAFLSGNFSQAVFFFTQAINLEPNNSVLFSNRSGAFASMKQFVDALADAERCIQINPGYVKGYSRKGAALHGLGRLGEAIAAYEEGLRVDPRNAACKEGLEEVKKLKVSGTDVGGNVGGNGNSAQTGGGNGSSMPSSFPSSSASSPSSSSISSSSSSPFSSPSSPSSSSPSSSSSSSFTSMTSIGKEEFPSGSQVTSRKKYKSYFLVDSLGSGANGHVYVGQHELTGAFRVIKIIKFYNKIDEKEKGVDAEIKVGKILQNVSEYLVQYEEVVKRNGECFIVMEYCPHGDLRKLLASHIEKKEPFEKEEILRFLFQLCLAVQALHGMGCVHRDINPSNIFIGEGGRYKLGDYGTARVLSDDNRPMMTVTGTMGYMAPEVMQSDEYNKEVDIYSLGCIVLEMMTLQHPFKNKNGALRISDAVLGKTNEVAQAVFEKYTPSFVNMAIKMMSVDPKERPSIEYVLYSQLFNAARDSLYRGKK